MHTSILKIKVLWSSPPNQYHTCVPGLYLFEDEDQLAAYRPDFRHSKLYNSARAQHAQTCNAALGSAITTHARWVPKTTPNDAQTYQTLFDGPGTQLLSSSPNADLFSSFTPWPSRDTRDNFLVIKITFDSPPIVATSSNSSTLKRSRSPSPSTSYKRPALNSKGKIPLSEYESIGRHIRYIGDAPDLTWTPTTNGTSDTLFIDSSGIVTSIRAGLDNHGGSTVVLKFPATHHGAAYYTATTLQAFYERSREFSEPGPHLEVFKQDRIFEASTDTITLFLDFGEVVTDVTINITDTLVSFVRRHFPKAIPNLPGFIPEILALICKLAESKGLGLIIILYAPDRPVFKEFAANASALPFRKNSRFVFSTFSPLLSVIAEWSHVITTTLIMVSSDLLETSCQNAWSQLDVLDISLDADITRFLGFRGADLDDIVEEWLAPRLPNDVDLKQHLDWMKSVVGAHQLSNGTQVYHIEPSLACINFLAHCDPRQLVPGSRPDHSDLLRRLHQELSLIFPVQSMEQLKALLCLPFSTHEHGPLAIPTQLTLHELTQTPLTNHVYTSPVVVRVLLDYGLLTLSDDRVVVSSQCIRDLLESMFASCWYRTERVSPTFHDAIGLGTKTLGNWLRKEVDMFAIYLQNFKGDAIRHLKELTTQRLLAMRINESEGRQVKSVDELRHLHLGRPSSSRSTKPPPLAIMEVKTWDDCRLDILVIPRAPTDKYAGFFEIKLFNIWFAFKGTYGPRVDPTNPRLLRFMKEIDAIDFDNWLASLHNFINPNQKAFVTWDDQRSLVGHPSMYTRFQELRHEQVLMGTTWTGDGARDIMHLGSSTHPLTPAHIYRMVGWKLDESDITEGVCRREPLEHLIYGARKQCVDKYLTPVQHGWINHPGLTVLPLPKDQRTGHRVYSLVVATIAHRTIVDYFIDPSLKHLWTSCRFTTCPL